MNVRPEYHISLTVGVVDSKLPLAPKCKGKFYLFVGGYELLAYFIQPPISVSKQKCSIKRYRNNIFGLAEILLRESYCIIRRIFLLEYAQAS